MDKMGNKKFKYEIWCHSEQKCMCYIPWKKKPKKCPRLTLATKMALETLKMNFYQKFFLLVITHLYGNNFGHSKMDVDMGLD